MIICTNKKGYNSLDISRTLSLLIDDATNKTSPIGGVTKPIVRFTHIMIAKCSGCIPNKTIVGAKIGPNTRIAGPASKNIPTTSNIILINSNNK